MALDRERLHVVTGAVPLLGDHLRAVELAHLPGAVALHPALGAGERIVEAEVAGEGHGRADGDHRHLLHTTRHHHVAHAGQHRLGGEVDGLLRAAALSIDGGAGHVLGKVGRQPARAGDVARLPADGVDAPVDHVLHRGRVDARAGHQRP